MSRSTAAGPYFSFPVERFSSHSIDSATLGNSLISGSTAAVAAASLNHASHYHNLHSSNHHIYFLPQGVSGIDDGNLIGSGRNGENGFFFEQAFCRPSSLSPSTSPSSKPIGTSGTNDVLLSHPHLQFLRVASPTHNDDFDLLHKSHNSLGLQTSLSTTLADSSHLSPTLLPVNDDSMMMRHVTDNGHSSHVSPGTDTNSTLYNNATPGRSSVHSHFSPHFEALPQSATDVLVGATKKRLSSVSGGLTNTAGSHGNTDHHHHQHNTDHHHHQQSPARRRRLGSDCEVIDPPHQNCFEQFEHAQREDSSLRHRLPVTLYDHHVPINPALTNNRPFVTSAAVSSLEKASVSTLASPSSLTACLVAKRGRRPKQYQTQADDGDIASPSDFESKRDIILYIEQKLESMVESFTFKSATYQTHLKQFLPRPDEKQRRYIERIESFPRIPTSLAEQRELVHLRKVQRGMTPDSRLTDCDGLTIKERLDEMLTSLVNKIMFLLVVKFDTWYIHAPAREQIREQLLEFIWPELPDLHDFFREHFSLFIDMRIRHFRDSVARYFRDRPRNDNSSKLGSSTQQSTAAVTHAANLRKSLDLSLPSHESLTGGYPPSFSQNSDDFHTKISAVVINRNNKSSPVSIQTKLVSTAHDTSLPLYSMGCDSHGASAAATTASFMREQSLLSRGSSTPRFYALCSSSGQLPQPGTSAPSEQSGGGSALSSETSSPYSSSSHHPFPTTFLGSSAGSNTTVTSEATSGGGCIRLIPAMLQPATLRSQQVVPSTPAPASVETEGHQSTELQQHMFNHHSHYYQAQPHHQHPPHYNSHNNHTHLISHHHHHHPHSSAVDEAGHFNGTCRPVTSDDNKPSVEVFRRLLDETSSSPYPVAPSPSSSSSPYSGLSAVASPLTAVTAEQVYSPGTMKVANLPMNHNITNSLSSGDQESQHQHRRLTTDLLLGGNNESHHHNSSNTTNTAVTTGRLDIEFTVASTPPPSSSPHQQQQLDNRVASHFYNHSTPAEKAAATTTAPVLTGKLPTAAASASLQYSFPLGFHSSESLLSSNSSMLSESSHFCHQRTRLSQGASSLEVTNGASVRLGAEGDGGGYPLTIEYCYSGSGKSSPESSSTSYSSSVYESAVADNSCRCYGMHSCVIHSHPLTAEKLNRLDDCTYGDVGTRDDPSSSSTTSSAVASAAACELMRAMPPLMPMTAAAAAAVPSSSSSSGVSPAQQQNHYGGGNSGLSLQSTHVVDSGIADRCDGISL